MIIIIIVITTKLENTKLSSGRPRRVVKRT